MALTWSQDKFIKAFNFAAHAHQGKLLPGSSLPYLTHVSLVCMEVMALQSVEPMQDPDLALQCAALHDVVEDTQITLDKIREDFGVEVANGVAALTKKELPNAMEDSLCRIQMQPEAIWIVKLADRITNLQPPPSFWTEERKKEYLDESLVILDKLKKASLYLAERLNSKIDAYRMNCFPK